MGIKNENNNANGQLDRALEGIETKLRELNLGIEALGEFRVYKSTLQRPGFF